MAGKKGRSGRPKGALSWPNNPVALAGHHLNVLVEMWLAGVPMGCEIWMWGEQAALWRGLSQPDQRRHTVPPKVKRVLAQMAIDHVLKLYPEMRPPEPAMGPVRANQREAARQARIDAVLYWSRRRAPASTLRRAKTARAKMQ